VTAAGTRDARTGLSGGAATLALARLALVRAVRGKAMWLALGLALLPVIIVSVRVGLGHDRDDVWRAALELSLLILTVVPSILVGPSLADELEDKTSAYLWSRALPRWSIVAGKLLGLAPAAMLILLSGLTLSWAVAGGPSAVPADVALRGLAGLAAAGLVASVLVAAIATLVPRHAVATAVVYLLIVDAPLGALPLKLQFVSVAFGGRAIAGFTDSGVAAGAITLVAIGALTGALSLWRIGRME
jgi:ABC-type transport system involved in multi-copper enzyme maturation permease subunit